MKRDALGEVLAGEAAVSLGRAGQRLAEALGRLEQLGADAAAEQCEELEYHCADLVWRYFVQREACGLRNHARVIEHYGIPQAVLNKVGVLTPSRDSA